MISNYIIIPGLTYGSQLALGALGITIVYSVLRFSNFAHGEFMSFGAMSSILLCWLFISLEINLYPLPTAILVLPIAIIFTIFYCLIRRLLASLKFVKKINKDRPITFFEITTAAAFVLFSKFKADFLILETGLGGRLDATNIIPKKFLSIITSIGIDHEEFLGNTLKKITNEKLGIIKNTNNIIIAKQNKEVENFIFKKLKKMIIFEA